jgi:hypothetical protein
MKYIKKSHDQNFSIFLGSENSQVLNFGQTWRISYKILTLA